MTAQQATDLKALVVEDSPVFSALTASTIRMEYPGARVLQCRSFVEAQATLGRSPVDVIVCGAGLSDGSTAHDIARMTPTPMVVMSGRLGDVDLPPGAEFVEKSAGPLALKDAIEECLRRR